MPRESLDAPENLPKEAPGQVTSASWRRIVAYKDGSRVWLVSRTGRDHAKRFPEIARAIRRLSAWSLILDGEVARFDGQLVSRFHLLHEETGERATPPVIVAFDCMWRRGRDLRGDLL